MKKAFYLVGQDSVLDGILSDGEKKVKEATQRFEAFRKEADALRESYWDAVEKRIGELKILPAEYLAAHADARSLSYDREVGALMASWGEKETPLSDVLKAMGLK